MYVPQKGTRKERLTEIGSDKYLQSGSTEMRWVGALHIWQAEYWEPNADTGMLGCSGEGCGMIIDIT